MRISTTWSHQQGVNALLEQQIKLNQSQISLSSGKKYLAPSDNPNAVTKLVDLQQNIKVNEQYQVNIGSARQRLELQESALTNVTDTLQRIQELTTQGLNGINTPEDRKAIAAEIDQLKDHLFGIANTKNANGEYLFSGYKSDKPAYSYDPSTTDIYSFDGDTNRRSIAIGPDRTVTDGDPGENVFGLIVDTSVTPLTPGSITNVFQAIDKISTDLKANTPDSKSLGDLEKALDRISVIRSSTGARLNALDDQENLNADYILDHQITASEIGDLDLAEALTKFNSQQVALQAAQSAFSKVQNLSLFNYI